ncbi:MAG TPA: DUF1983 domain-containing protein, partial [Clostridia bacterium]|nr:DUF1983 domain-containing protein [Clostridia bacterium]
SSIRQTATSVSTLVEDMHGENGVVSQVNQLADEYTVKMQETADGKTVSVGFGMAKDATGNWEFAVIADRFRIIGVERDQNGNIILDEHGRATTTADQAVFALDTVTNKLYLLADLIANGTITAEMLATDALKSRNYSDTAGSFLDLANGQFKLGGALNPALAWDGSQLKLTGTIVQSPSGAEFRVPVWRGAYSSTTTYYMGDVVSYGGSSWIFMNDTPKTGEEPVIGSPYWDIYVEKGDKGESAPELKIEYSASQNGPWSSSYVEGHFWMRTSNNGGNTWSAPMRIVGEDGDDGQDGKYTDYQFAKNTSLITAPTSGWADAPPSLGTTEYLWMRSRVVTPSGAGDWTTPVRISGPKGPAGQVGAFQGDWASGKQYVGDAIRGDIVKGTDGKFYICRGTHTSSSTTRPISGGSWSIYWRSFGATFESVATKLLLAHDATILKTLTMGDGGIIQSHDGAVQFSDLGVLVRDLVSQELRLHLGDVSGRLWGDGVLAPNTYGLWGDQAGLYLRGYARLLIAGSSEDEEIIDLTDFPNLSNPEILVAPKELVSYSPERDTLSHLYVDAVKVPGEQKYVVKAKTMVKGVTHDNWGTVAETHSSWTFTRPTESTDGKKGVMTDFFICRPGWRVAAGGFGVYTARLRMDITDEFDSNGDPINWETIRTFNQSSSGSGTLNWDTALPYHGQWAMRVRGQGGGAVLIKYAFTRLTRAGYRSGDTYLDVDGDEVGGSDPANTPSGMSAVYFVFDRG